MSEDPIGFGGGDTNLRRAVHNTPLTRVDPDGLEGQDIEDFFSFRSRILALRESHLLEVQGVTDEEFDLILVAAWEVLLAQQELRVAQEAADYRAAVSSQLSLLIKKITDYPGSCKERTAVYDRLQQARDQLEAANKELTVVAEKVTLVGTWILAGERVRNLSFAKGDDAGQFMWVLLRSGGYFGSVEPTGDEEFVIIAVQLSVSGGRRLIGTLAKVGITEDALFAQYTFREVFSAHGRAILSKAAKRSIRTIDDLVKAIECGAIKVSEIEVNYIVRNGTTYILNTRTSEALKRAGISRIKWKGAVNRSGNKLYEALLDGQLKRAKLGPGQGVRKPVPEGK